MRIGLPGIPRTTNITLRYMTRLVRLNILALGGAQGYEPHVNHTIAVSANTAGGREGPWSNVGEEGVLIRIWGAFSGQR